MKNKNEQLLKHMAGGGCQLLFSAIGFGEVTYTEEQLWEVENLLHDFYYQKDILPTTAIPFGFYLGQTMVQNIKGAEWHNLDTQNLFDLQVLVKGKPDDKSDGGTFYFKPFERIFKFIKDDTDKPSAMLWMAKALAENTPQELMAKGEPMTDGWYKFPSGHMLRLFKKISDGEKQAQ